MCKTHKKATKTETNKLRSRPKGGFGLPICRGGIPQFLDMRFQIAVTSEHVADFGWILFSELGIRRRKKKKKERKKNPW